ncbi:hypothetical protein [Luteirhabdus pelagi]|uniref:hypothetical protein n=1 Tax=Luteirhabdus pelagi TaxID=2792783 RepID=UPI001939C129|nr:hypothetical protein [Luteirhabdus pelagi]
MQQTIRFSGIMLLVLAVTFGVHLTVLFLLELPLFQHKIVLAYIVNVVFGILLVGVLQYRLSSTSAQTGFIFMIGSGVKFLLFFLLFYPSYNADDTMETIEFVTFFVPYAMCLIVEVTFLSKQLNNQSYDPSEKTEEGI